MKPWAMFVHFSLAASLLSVGPASAQAPALLDCAKVFTKTMDEAALMKQFGKPNVQAGKVSGAEGETIPATIVFPNDPKRRLEVTWNDADKRKRLSSVTVRDGSQWLVQTTSKTTSHTFGLKASIDAVEEANEKPFGVFGFYWDMGGYAAGWNGGKLETLDGGCSVSVRFNPDEKTASAAKKKASGEKKFSSSDAAIVAVKPTVSQISIDWPE